MYNKTLFSMDCHPRYCMVIPLLLNIFLLSYIWIHGNPPPTPSLLLPPIKTRDAIGSLLQAQGPSFSRGLELGVQYGSNAKELLSQWQHCKIFYLVDTWKQEVNYQDLANRPNEEQERIYDSAKQLLYPWREKVHFLRMPGRQAVAKLQQANIKFDFIYLDARHDYCAVMEDLHLFYPLLDKNGIMAGHDYLEAKDVPGQDWSLCASGERHPGGVKGAVDEFTRTHHHQLLITYGDSPWNSWMFRKQ